MAYDNSKLLKIKERTIKKEELSAKLRERNKHRYEVRSGVLELKRIMEDEQEDVNRLKEINAASILYKITGKYKKKYEEEYFEACDASLAYKKAAAVLEKIDNEIARLEQEFRNLGDCDREYIFAFREKQELILASCTAAAEIIKRMYYELMTYKSEMERMHETIGYGRNVVNYANSVTELTEKIWNMGGFDDDSSYMRRLENELREYKELVSERLYLFKENLISISSFAKKYDDDLSVFSRFMDSAFKNANIYDDNYPSLVRNTNPVVVKLERIYDVIDGKNDALKAVYEKAVLEYDL